MEDIKKIEPKTVADVFQIAPIALDTYDDIFSDFDPSPFDHRIISEDFLSELRRRYHMTPKDNFVVHFTLPKTLRSEKIEVLVRRRIKEHFREYLRKIHKQINERKNSGYLSIGVGIIVLAVNTFTRTSQIEILISISEFLLVVSWYFFWNGLERIFEPPEKLTLERSFLEKFAKAEYIFVDQEEVVKTITTLQGSGYL